MDACISSAKRCASVASFASRHLVEEALTDSVDVVGVEATVTADVVVSLAEATCVVEGVEVDGVWVEEANGFVWWYLFGLAIPLTETIDPFLSTVA